MFPYLKGSWSMSLLLAVYVSLSIVELTFFFAIPNMSSITFQILQDTWITTIYSYKIWTTWLNPIFQFERGRQSSNDCMSYRQNDAMTNNFLCPK